MQPSQSDPATQPGNSPVLVAIRALAIIAENDQAPRHLRERNLRAIIDAAINIVPGNKRVYWMKRILKTRTASGKIALCRDIVDYWERRPDLLQLLNEPAFIEMPDV